MRQVFVPSLKRGVSAIGFGCASLGSRVSAPAASRAVALALDLGVTWFDVAPPYGDGRAEGLLGRFLRGRRHAVVICTKFGIQRPHISAGQRLIRPLARSLVAAFPRLRGFARSSRATGRRGVIDPTTIESSLKESLRQLATDYIDVLAVHEPSLGDVHNSEVFEVMRRLVERGMVRAIAVAGSPDAVLAAIEAGQGIDCAQFPTSIINDNFSRVRQMMPSGAPTLLVTHGVFSDLQLTPSPVFDDKMQRLSHLSKRLELPLSCDPAEQLLYRAFCENPTGVVVASMIDRRHLAANCRLAERKPDLKWAEDVKATFARVH
jgi:hypothetical protein